jgi:hypothetical protein
MAGCCDMAGPAHAFRAAVRAALVADERLTALVEPGSVRAGQGRPDTSPCVVLGEAQARPAGPGRGGRHVARVELPLHVWIRHDWSGGRSVDDAKRIGAVLLRVLARPPAMPAEVALDAYHPPQLDWRRDPIPDLAWMHITLDLGAVLSWRDTPRQIEVG